MQVLVRRAALFLVCGVVLALGRGKSGDRPKGMPARGQVLYHGQPVEGAVVTFTNSAANVSAYAKTGADGRFRLTTFGHEDGAVPGPQKVAVSRVEVINRAIPGVDSGTTSAVPAPAEEKHLLPERCARPDTSGLEVEVEQGEKNDFTLELK